MTTIPDISKEPFISWFKDSQIRDSEGNPLVCHHHGASKIGSFNPFSHFGTLKAAKSRATAKRIAAPVQHEVYLNLTKPLKAVDDQADNNPLKLLNWALSKGVFTVAEVQDLLEGVSDAMGQATITARSAEEHTALKWKGGMEVLAPRLSSWYGYDGIIYDNTIEGDTSYVNFRSDQVWQIGKSLPDR